MPLIHGERDPNLDCRPVVQVPAPLTADEARQILADARPWVPLPDGPSDAHVCKRVRIQYANGRVEGTLLRSFDTEPRQFLLHGMPKQWDSSSGEWFVHPDDAPGRDRDVDLIDDLATALRKAWDANSGLARYPVSDPVWGDLARVAIERVRAEA